MFSNIFLLHLHEKVDYLLQFGKIYVILCITFCESELNFIRTTAGVLYLNVLMLYLFCNRSKIIIVWSVYNYLTDDFKY